VFSADTHTMPNAFEVLGYVRRALKRRKATPAEIELILSEMQKSKSYEQLLDKACIYLDPTCSGWQELIVNWKEVKKRQ
jgi:hypothetical protein